MKYLLLIYAKETELNETQMRECYAESSELAGELATRGHFLGASPLQHTTTATSVRVREGRPMVTDGPFAETREQLGGYFLVDVPDLDEAIRVAARIPAAKRGTVEIRPVVELPDLPTPHRA